MFSVIPLLHILYITVESLIRPVGLSMAWRVEGKHIEVVLQPLAVEWSSYLNGCPWYDGPFTYPPSTLHVECCLGTLLIAFRST